MENSIVSYIPPELFECIFLCICLQTTNTLMSLCLVSKLFHKYITCFCPYTFDMIETKSENIYLYLTKSKHHKYIGYITNKFEIHIPWNVKHLLENTLIYGPDPNIDTQSIYPSYAIKHVRNNPDLPFEIIKRRIKEGLISNVIKSVKTYGYCLDHDEQYNIDCYIQLFERYYHRNLRHVPKTVKRLIRILNTNNFLTFALTRNNTLLFNIFTHLGIHWINHLFTYIVHNDLITCISMLIDDIHNIHYRETHHYKVYTRESYYTPSVTVSTYIVSVWNLILQNHIHVEDLGWEKIRRLYLMANHNTRTSLNQYFIKHDFISYIRNVNVIISSIKNKLFRISPSQLYDIFLIWLQKPTTYWHNDDFNTFVHLFTQSRFNTYLQQNLLFVQYLTKLSDNDINMFFSATKCNPTLVHQWLLNIPDEKTSSIDIALKFMI